MTNRLAPLFEPFQLGRLELRNRFAMAPMTRSRSPLGVPGPNVAEYYRKRAAGEVGLIITEGIGIPHPAALGLSGVDILDIPHLDGQSALDGWRRVVDAVHAEGGRIAPQLWHQGVMRLDGTGDFPDAPSMRPSGLWGPRGGAALVRRDYLDQVPERAPPMTESDIADVIAAYARAAANARSVGFDAIALHGAHGYLIDSFLWRETNRRQDRWGEPSRFAVEVVRAVRAAAGADMPILFRFSQWKLQDSDARIADTPAGLEALLGPIADAGVDLFDASDRHFDRPAFAGSTLGLAGWARKLTGRASMAVGSIGLSGWLFERGAKGAAAVDDNLARLVERFEADEFDVAGVGRMLIANPDWVRRIRDGEPVSAYSRDFLDTLA